VNVEVSNKTEQTRLATDQLIQQRYTRADTYMYMYKSGSILKEFNCESTVKSLVN